ncbi:DUF4031 domain-containing protein [Herbaspirillum rhizosphaerae]|uniref:DUF4031 domain-containing protein n=1 Tax=Herbaspirillum rhizosphaerae TaxID=346179 RepID=UPI0009F960C5|nr:DUF4031 domain-containing protein [Herbaspirillum rhizosphaerae]
MAVYIDNAQIRWRNRYWCHLAADSLTELHSFAQKLGLLPTWFQDHLNHPHYDVTQTVRIKALRLGAISCDSRQIVRSAREARKLSCKRTAESSRSYS